MSVLPPEVYTVEVLSEAPTTRTESNETGVDVIVEVGSVSADAQPMVPTIIEIATFPPVGGGYNRVEVIPFSLIGTLSVTPAGAEFPIGGGNFLLESIAARVTTPPTGSSVVLDVLKNNDRPTIAAGTNNAVVGTFPATMFATGDYLEVIIVSVGSTTPGQTLTTSIRISRVG
jgi:hypothetical protein